MAKQLMVGLILLCSVQAGMAQTLPENYDFGLGITYEISSGKNGNLQKGEQLAMWFSKGDYTGMESPKRKGFFMVMDLKTQKMVTLLTDQKMAMVMDLGKMQQRMQGQGKEDKQAAVKVSKTGKSATIAGYHCIQYLVESDDSRSLVWITNELGNGMGNFAKSLAAMLETGPKPIRLPSMSGMENGVMLRMETTDKKSGNSSNFEAVAVSKEGRKLATTGFKVMAMPGQ
ncbi:MAG: hypothetical protein A1D16_00170 [Flavihumibacter sp. CACIAM 22H1]|nr:MAG: hypothetical protein A1D16_00170 [Flavihumibacter sp. CACIAM 22H1]